jgi:hypothetical protein
MCLQFRFVIFWQKDFGAKAAHKMLVKLTPGVNFIKHFPSSLMPRPNKLDRLSLETLSSQVLEFASKVQML